MSNFNENSDIPIFVIGYNALIGTSYISSQKKCYEFVWKSGDGRHGPGFGFSKSVYIRYRHDLPTEMGSKGLTRSPSGDSFSGDIGEPVLLCLDVSDQNNMKFHIIKGDKKRSSGINLSTIPSPMKWRLFLWSSENSSKSDIVELHLRKKNIKNKIPEGFSAWLGDKRDAEFCRNKTSLHFIVSIIFLSR